MASRKEVMETQMRQTYRNASMILVTPRLALTTQLIEIKFIAKVR